MPSSEETPSRQRMMVFRENSQPSIRSVDTVDELVKSLDMAFFKSPTLPNGLLGKTPAESGEFLVEWESTSDPKNPKNWRMPKKNLNIGIISVITFLTSSASSMLAPGIPEIMNEFGSDNNKLASFVLSVYVLGYAAGPTVIAPLSELYGRVKLYNITNILFFVFTLACGLTPSLAMLIASRFLAGCAGAAPMAVGGGSIADIIPPELRGRAVAIFSLGPVLAPVLSPIAGGYVTKILGWRWIFYILTISSGIVTLFSIAFLRETSAKTLLERKARRLRKEKNDERYKSSLANDLSPREALARSIFRPLQMLFTQPVIFFLSIYVAVVYGYLYMFLTTFTPIFQGQYNFPTNIVGLSYVGLGVGFIVGVVSSTFFGDRLALHLTKQNGGSSKPEFRLPPMVYTSPITPIGVLIYGWTAQMKLPWILPMIGTSLVGVGLMLMLMPLQTYLLDAFTRHAASAIAAATIIRSLFGATLPLAGQPLYDKLGLGWGNSLLAFITVVIAPIPWFCMKYGESMRMRYAITFD